MNLPTMARQLPLRLAAGRYVLNSGLSKWKADEASQVRAEDGAA
jgi:hypothetical protein